MVIPCGIAAAKAASAAGSAGATALGIGIGKTDLNLSRDVFKMQMQQTKRLWTADWAEASVRHGEQCMQSAQQHAEAQGMATASYFQAEKIASQGFKLARDQDSRAYEMSWRAEVRETLRDELANQNNRFNIIMLCDTVCLSCVFSLVADGSLPDRTAPIMVNSYVFCMGLSITLFSISLWCSLIVVRRLHEHTAAILERKLFAQSEELQKAWEHQLKKNLPTGPNELHLVNQAYERWVSDYLDPIGKLSIQLMSFGVVAMFITAGLLTHNVYLIEFNSFSAIIIFWTFVFITSSTVIYMKFSEDISEKKKEGVYDGSWHDKSSLETGPFAKIYRAAEELFSNSAVQLGSTERMESFSDLEESERNLCNKTKSLQHRVNSLRMESKKRVATREEVLKLLTTAAEELDALPEELTSTLNKIIYNIDETDQRTAELITISPQNVIIKTDSSRRGCCSQRLKPRQPMSPHPLDAQRIPVSLAPLRKKFGEIHLTTLLRLKNMSDEPLRLKSGVQLKEGKYIMSLNSTSPQGNSACYHLYPGTEIPPRTEVLVASRSRGAWVPISGIDGTVVYTNRDESWIFRISFRNELLARNGRRCEVKAIRLGRFGKAGGNKEQHWKISKDEFDRKANNEVAVSIDLLQGEEAAKAAFDHRQSYISLKAGFLLKSTAFALGIHWLQRWFELTPIEIVYQDIETNKKSKIAIKDIKAVRKSSDVFKKNIFEIETFVKGRRPHKLAAASPQDRDDWIRKISDAAESIRLNNLESLVDKDETSLPSEDFDTNSIQDAIECVPSERGYEVLPPSF